jgi:hypothetical protein
MPSAKNKINKEKEIDWEISSAGRPSPHILDLKKIISETRETRPAAQKQDNKKFSKNDYRRKFPNPFYLLTNLVGKISSTLAGGLRVIFGLAKRAASSLLFFPKNIAREVYGFSSRFFSFLKYDLADYRKILNFGLVAFIFVLPLQVFSYFGNLKETGNEALRGAEKAYESLMAGSAEISDSNFSAAAAQFDEAAGQFGLAGTEIQEINFAVANLIKAMPVGGDKFSAGEAVIFSGEKFAWAGGRIMQSIADFSAKEDERKLTKKIKILRNRLAVILPEVSAATERLSGVKLEAVPEDKREAFAKLQNRLPGFVQSLKKLISISDLMVKFLGDESDKRYLFVFQNSSEIRPTGGFMGSLALVDFNRGEIRNLEVPGGGPYDFTGSLKERIIAPEPLRLVNARWELQDANWFPDFPASAAKVKWFYEKGGGPTVDGVIAINSDFVAELLGIVGPIDMPEYGETMNQKNFVDEMQKDVELEYDKKENKPKKIIGDMMPKLIEKITASDPGQFGKILSVALKSLQEKDILVYSVYPEVEHEILNLGWGGQIKDAGDNSDFLAVINANLGGGKTDKVINQTVDLKTTISEDGYVKNRLTIRRAHGGVKGEAFTGVRNVDYIRVYVPKGSTLLSVQGFEAPPENLFEKPESDYRADADLKNIEGRTMIDAASGTRINIEFGKTVFGNWIQVDPGEEATVTLEYLLPFKLFFVGGKEESWLDAVLGRLGDRGPEKVFYQLMLQKQPGAKSDFTGRIDFPINWQPAWLYGEGAGLGDLSVNVAAPLSSDRLYSVGFIKK